MATDSTLRLRAISPLLSAFRRFHPSREEIRLGPKDEVVGYRPLGPAAKERHPLDEILEAAVAKEIADRKVLNTVLPKHARVTTNPKKVRKIVRREWARRDV